MMGTHQAGMGRELRSQWAATTPRRYLMMIGSSPTKWYISRFLRWRRSTTGLKKVWLPILSRWPERESVNYRRRRFGETWLMACRTVYPKAVIAVLITPRLGVARIGEEPRFAFLPMSRSGAAPIIKKAWKMR